MNKAVRSPKGHSLLKMQSVLLSIVLYQWFLLYPLYASSSKFRLYFIQKYTQHMSSQALTVKYELNGSFREFFHCLDYHVMQSLAWSLPSRTNFVEKKLKVQCSISLEQVIFTRDLFDNNKMFNAGTVFEGEF